MSSSPCFLDPVIIPLIRGESVLDVGCGYGKWAHLIQTNFWEAGLSKPPIIDGFDAFEPNIELCSKSNCYRKTWIQKMPSAISGEWDTVLACEFIEHINQNCVDEVVNILESVTKKRIIISTPNWPYFREGGDTKVGFNDFEAHLSFIPRKYFTDRGYKVFGAGFRNPLNYFHRVMNKLNISLEFFLESIPRRLPSIASLIVAYKDMED